MDRPSPEHPQLSEIITKARALVWDDRDYAEVGHLLAQLVKRCPLDDYNLGILLSSVLREYHTRHLDKPPVPRASAIRRGDHWIPLIALLRLGESP